MKKRSIWIRQQLVLKIDESVKAGARKAAARAGVSLTKWSEKVLARAAGVALVQEPRTKPKASR